MRAVVYRGVSDLRVETVPVPRIQPDELLVKVAACGVCPTDIKKIQYGTGPPPRIFGHETAGVNPPVCLAGGRFLIWGPVSAFPHPSPFERPCFPVPAPSLTPRAQPGREPG